MLEITLIKNRLEGEVESQTWYENPGHFNGINYSKSKHVLNIPFLLPQVNSICTGQ